MTSRTLEQQRATHALAQVKEVQDVGGILAAGYAASVKGLPASILMNGLGQAMATIRAKNGEDALQMIYRHVSLWLCIDCPNSLLKRTNTSDILEAVCATDQDGYVWAQAEGLRYLEWLKKFAAAYLSEGKRS